MSSGSERPLNFEPTPAIRSIVERAEALIDGEVIPLEQRFLSEPFADLEGALEGVRARVREAGLWGPPFPRELGGMGLDLVQFGLVSEALGQSPLGHYVFGCQAPDAGNIEILRSEGTGAQKDRYLRPLVQGQMRSCFAMTEPEHAGSNPTILSTSARREGAGYVLDGHKWFATSADGAAFAIVMAETDATAPPHSRASLFLVPTDAPGFEIVRNVSIMGHVGSGWLSHAEIRIEGCRVLDTDRLGEEGAGFAIAQARLGPGRIHHCMRWLGICRRAFSMMCERARAREVGPGRTLAKTQLAQAAIAECKAEIEAARLFVLSTAQKIDTVGAKAARSDISLIKFHTAGVLQRVVDAAVQMHGGLGVTDDTILAYFFRAERAARIYDGVDEVHKLAAARALLA